MGPSRPHTSASASAGERPLDGIGGRQAAGGLFGAAEGDLRAEWSGVTAAVEDALEAAAAAAAAQTDHEID